MASTAQTSGSERARSPSYRRQPRPAPSARPHRPEFPRESLCLRGAAPGKLETTRVGATRPGTRPQRACRLRTDPDLLLPELQPTIVN